MPKFNYLKYLKLKDNEVLKIRLKNTSESIFVSAVSQSVLQAYQPAHTPITKVNLEVIKDLETYKEDKDDEENVHEIRVEPEEIEEFELIEI